MMAQSGMTRRRCPPALFHGRKWPPGRILSAPSPWGSRMVGEDRPAAPPEGSQTDGGEPFDALPRGMQVGKYEIVETLGQGGFGITYRARDMRLGRDVAIKEYLPTSFARREGASTVLPRSTHTA